MRYCHFEKYLNHYVEGAKKVTVRTFRHNDTSDGSKSKKKLIDSFVVFFNNNGRLLGLQIYFEKMKWKKHLFFYDSKGQIIRVLITDVNNELEEQIDYTYYEDGRPEKESWFSFFTDTMCLESEEEFIYKGNSKMTIKKDYCSEPEQVWAFDSKYSEDGKLLEEKIEEIGVEIIDWIKYEYCEDGSIIEKHMDENGNYLKEEKYKEVGCDYVYNDRNHWIKEFNGKATNNCFTTEREIEYYV